MCLRTCKVLNYVLLTKNMRGILVTHPFCKYRMDLCENTHFGYYFYDVFPVHEVAYNKFCSLPAVMSWALFIHHKLKLLIMTRSFWALTECTQLLITIHFGTKIISWPSQHQQFIHFLSLPRVLIQVQVMSTKRSHLEVILI